MPFLSFREGRRPDFSLLSNPRRSIIKRGIVQKGEEVGCVSLSLGLPHVPGLQGKCSDSIRDGFSRCIRLGGGEILGRGWRETFLRRGSIIVVVVGGCGCQFSNFYYYIGHVAGEEDFYGVEREREAAFTILILKKFHKSSFGELS